MKHSLAESLIDKFIAEVLGYDVSDKDLKNIDSAL